jgi:hypothetical protein
VQRARMDVFGRGWRWRLCNLFHARRVYLQRRNAPVGIPLILLSNQRYTTIV